MASISSKFPIAVTLGSNIASATPSADGSADLISAATNTGGIIITSIAVTVTEVGDSSNAVRFAYVTLSVGGSVIAKIIGTGARDGTTAANGAAGNIVTGCAIRVAAGQAVSYTFEEIVTGTAEIYVTWSPA